MKHKHHELIKAWADGAVIQYKTNDGTWVTKANPSWLDNYEYRIKPAEPERVVNQYTSKRTADNIGCILTPSLNVVCGSTDCLGEWFPTKEQAEFERDVRNARYKVLKRKYELEPCFVPDWGDGDIKYFPEASHLGKTIAVQFSRYSQFLPGEWYAEHQETWETIAKEFGREYVALAMGIKLEGKE